jgi:hypothetical protein
MLHEPSDRDADDAPSTDPTGRRYRESAAGSHPRTPDGPPGPRPGVFSDPDVRRPAGHDGDIDPAEPHDNGRVC